jgi:hypothetical protein
MTLDTTLHEQRNIRPSKNLGLGWELKDRALRSRNQEATTSEIIPAIVEFIGHTSLIVILYLLFVVVILSIVTRSVSCAQNNFATSDSQSCQPGPPAKNCRLLIRGVRDSLIDMKISQGMSIWLRERQQEP